MAAHANIAAADLRRLLVDADLPITTVASVLKVSAPTIRRHCRAHGIELDRGPGPKSKLPPADAILIIGVLGLLGAAGLVGAILLGVKP